MKRGRQHRQQAGQSGLNSPTEMTLLVEGNRHVNKHPAKLIVLYPIFTVEGCRRRLTAIDDALVVHHGADGRFDFDHRLMVTLTACGPNSYATALGRLADDLERGYRVIMVQRDDFIRDLETQALAHATDENRAAVELAAHVVAGRTLFQLRDHQFPGTAEYEIAREIHGMRERRTKPERGEGPGLNLQNGIVTPRAEALWHTLRSEWCSPRVEQQGRIAWESWCRRNRPSMPVTAS